MMTQSILFAATSAKLTAWITPLWLMSLGVVLGLIILAIFYGALRLFSARAAEAFSDGVRESWLLPVFYLSLLITLFAIVATPAVPYRSLLAAVSRIPNVGAAEHVETIPPANDHFNFEIPFRTNEIVSFTLESDRPLTVITHVQHGAGQDGAFKLVAGKADSWRHTNLLEKAFEPAETREWTAKNLGDAPAKLTIRSVTDIEFPQVRIAPMVAAAFVLLVTVFMLLRWLAPKESAIALAAAKESMGQPLFYILLMLGLMGLVLSIYIPYNTFGEDIKMLKDTGLTTIMLLAIILAIWSASTSISEEIEGKTALTLLSKPIHRWQFIVGKFLGIVGPVILVHLILGVPFLATISYKVVYDAREVSLPDPTWQQCYVEVVRTIPGMVLSFYETMVLAAISVALSTRLPMAANLMVCISIYALGHLAPMIVNSSLGKNPIVEFVGQFIAAVLPNLDHFDIKAAIAGGAEVPTSYLLWTLLYCVMFCLGSMLVALGLFEDRDLA